MIFNLSDIEVRKRLIKNTIWGKPTTSLTLLFSTYSFSAKEKIFLGQIEKSSFKITLNNCFFPFPYKLEGSISKINDTETNVEYTMKPMLWRIWVLIISRGLAFLFVLFVASTLPDLKSKLVPTILFFLLLIAIPLYRFKINKQKLRKEFLRILN